MIVSVHSWVQNTGGHPAVEFTLVMLSGKWAAWAEKTFPSLGGALGLTSGCPSHVTWLFFLRCMCVPECYEWARHWSILTARQPKPWPLQPRGSFNSSLQSTSAFAKLWSPFPLTDTLLSLLPWVYALKTKAEAGLTCRVPVNLGSWYHYTRTC